MSPFLAVLGLEREGGDVALVERVLENLIDNALNHTSSDGHIRIPIAARDGEVEFSVSDSGEGIPAEAQSRIFDRFYQVRNEHRGSGHTGLGLSIAKRIVELHHGVLRVESTPGVGSRCPYGGRVETRRW